MPARYSRADELRMRAEAEPPPYKPDPLLIGLREGDMERHLSSRWRRWRFRNRADYFKIACIEALLGLPATTDPDQWEI